jgi:hypothetical protein
MGYAKDRQYTNAQAAVRICDYIRKHRTITIREAMRVTGRRYWSVWRLLIELDEVLGMYIQSGGAGVELRRALLEDAERE